MKPIGLLFYFSAALILWAAPAQRPAPPPAPLEHRFLFVVDTSISMKRLDAANRQALFDLIYHGLNGQMLPGDTYGVWTFDENIYAGDFPMQVWNPTNNLELASQAATYLKGRRYRGETRLQQTVEKLRTIIRAVKDVNIFIVSDGDAPMTGTAVDEAVNASYKSRAQERRQAKRPFITTLVARNGKLVNVSVTIAGELIHLPQRPPRSTVVKASGSASANVQSNRAPSTSNQKMPQPAQAETSDGNAVQTRRVPSIIIQNKPPLPAPGSLASTIVAPDPTTPTNTAVPPPQPVSSAAEASDIGTATLSPISQATSVTANTNEPKRPPLADNLANSSTNPASAKGAAPQPSTPAAVPSPSASAASLLDPNTIRVAAREPSASTNVAAAVSPGLTALAVAPESFLTPRTMVFIGAGLAVLAGGLFLLVMKRLRSAPQSSFISRSMER